MSYSGKTYELVAEKSFQYLRCIFNSHAFPYVPTRIAIRVGSLRPDGKYNIDIATNYESLSNRVAFFEETGMYGEVFVQMENSGIFCPIGHLPLDRMMED